VVTALALALLFSFLVIFFGTKWQVNISMKFPAASQC